MANWEMIKEGESKIGEKFWVYKFRLSPRKGEKN